MWKHNAQLKVFSPFILKFKLVLDFSDTLGIRPQPGPMLTGKTCLSVQVQFFAPIYDTVNVVAQLYPWFNFYFPLFLCMVMHENEHKTKEIDQNLNQG